MAQKRFHNYRDTVDSNRLIQHLAIVHTSGRYAGFNELRVTSGMNANVHHELPGYEVTRTLAPYSQGTEPNIGLWVSKQGSAIQEDDGINITCQSNSSNAFVRYDLFYGEHQYAQVIGGQAATYGIVTGVADRTIPALTNPDIQTPLGIIEIPANATDLSQAKFWPYKIPTLGAEDVEIWEDLTSYINTGDGWAQQGSVPIQARRDKQGWVHFRGLINGTAAGIQIAFQGVPDRFLPTPLTGYTSISRMLAPTGFGVQPAPIVIQGSTGNIEIDYSLEGTSGNRIYSLNGLSYYRGLGPRA